jgi:hypothetical protein
MTLKEDNIDPREDSEMESETPQHNKDKVKIWEAEERFGSLDRILMEFENDHVDLLEEYSDLVSARESARIELENAVRETLIPSLDMRPTVITKINYNGFSLFNILLKNQKLRDSIVKIEYTVDKNALKAAIDSGKLKPETIEKAISSKESIIQIRNKIKPHAI